jgi:hypothetical protein
MVVAFTPSVAVDFATFAAIIPAIAPRRQLHRGGSIEIAMEQRTAAIKFGGWSEFGVAVSFWRSGSGSDAI